MAEGSRTGKGGSGVLPRNVRLSDDRPEPARERPLARVRRAAWRWTKRVAVFLVLSCLAGFGILVWVIRSYEAELPRTTQVRGNYHPPQVTRVLARDGSVLAEMFTERRTVVSLASLPPHVRLAFLAAEDAQFYEHEGVNYFKILRALFVNLRAGKAKQGGSTITQQVVKNVLIQTNEKTYSRKLREALLARKLEEELTKDEILELYLNHIYFGRGRYGIEEAARDNFGKSARLITVAEAALLAGIVASPDNYTPRHDMRAAMARRGYVLSQMQKKGFLPEEEVRAAGDEPVRLSPVSEPSTELAPEVVEYVRKTLREVDADGAKRGGYTVHTTIDPKLQALARRALREGLSGYDARHKLLGPLRAPQKKGKGESPFEGIPKYDHKGVLGQVSAHDDAAGTFEVRVGDAVGSVKLSDFERYNPKKLAPSAFAPLGALVRVSLLAPLPEGPKAAEVRIPLRLESGPEGALVAIDARTRAIVALVGSYEADPGTLDRATQAHRQPGSTFKPLVYSYALHTRRYTPATLVDVNPEVFEGNYRPTNYEGWAGKDPVRLRDALAQSVNLVSVRVLRDVGKHNVVSWAKAFGIQSHLGADLSLALGSYEVTPLELATAYSVFAAGGVAEEPLLIQKIVGPDGKEHALRARAAPRPVLDEAENYVMTSMLTSVIERGTAASAKSLGRPLAGKTGTTNASRDTWFAGYSPDLVAVVWVGFDDNRPLGEREAGAITALPIWKTFMKGAHDGKPKAEFPRPSGVVSLTVDARTGKLPYEGDVDTVEEVFVAGTEPTERAEPPLDAGVPDAVAPTDEAGVDAGRSDGGIDL